MALLECPFPLLVLGPVLLQRLASRGALEDTARALDERRGHGFEKDSLRCGLDHGLGPVLDVELLAQAKRDDDLPLRREPYGFEFFSHTYTYKYDSSHVVCQDVQSRKYMAQTEFSGSLSIFWAAAWCLRVSRPLSHIQARDSRSSGPNLGLAIF